MMPKIKELFDYRKRWKHQKNRCKHLKKKVNRLSQNITEDLKLDVTNEEVRKLKIEVNRLKKRVIVLNQECQKYFNMLVEKGEK